MTTPWRIVRKCGLPGARALAVVMLAAAPLWESGAQSPEPPYRLRAGDRVAVTVYGHEDLSGEFELDARGRINLPLAGMIELAERTVRQAEAQVVDALRPDYLKHPRVGVRVLGHRPVYVVGEVEQPGRYPFVRGLTVVDAIALAGGYSDRARRDGMEILRGTGGARQPRPATEATRVLPGDAVRVPARGPLSLF